MKQNVSDYAHANEIFNGSICIFRLGVHLHIVCSAWCVVVNIHGVYPFSFVHKNERKI